MPTRDEYVDILTDYAKLNGVDIKRPISVPDLGKLLGCSRANIYDAIRRKELKASIQIGAGRRPRQRFTLDDVIDYQEFLLKARQEKGIYRE